ncbi:hypothetical protein N9A28_07255, partial [Sulfurimonas sp.]|nr:hypothetical protein [Sulfurimonas sp.]
LKKVKQEASKEIYGESIASETVMVNGRVLNDVVSQKSGGIIHVKDEPIFKNGEKFGELVVTITAYATDEDLLDYSLDNVKKTSTKKNLITQSTISTSREQIKKVKRGFYGQWNGFIMRSNGGSGDVNIDIEDSGLVSVNYNSLNCGGDLIIQEKGARLVKFKESLTYGKNKCVDEHFVELKKINNTQLLFMQFNKDNVEVARGTLYRDE